MNRIKIGVLGCASIAERMMIPAIISSDNFDLRFVASRSNDKSQKFANKFKCDYVVGYENLLEQDLDAIYIPLPTGMHYQWIMKSLEAGKHVIAEKSLATNYQEVRDIIDLARKKNLCVHENFMFQYHSQIKFVKDKLPEIGQIKLLRSSFGFPKFAEQSNFRYNKLLGGGALLDAGAYTIKASQIFLGLDQTLDYAYLNNEGSDVDFQGSIVLRNKDNITSQLAFGFDNFYQNKIEIWGNLGKITMNRAFTAGPGVNPIVMIEKQGSSTEYQLSADNHFIKSLEVFAKAINYRNYSERENILNQARLINEVVNWRK
ncbi:Gfo/Idh/MocA family oxidoreductase [bacterium]|nr:Gfo/Idh/MocA family oxidoreductase [bacterium]